MLVQRAEQQVIRKSHPMWSVIDDMCLKSKNLYNYANYIVRQEFIKNGNYINYYAMNKELKTHDPYKECMSQPANCTLRLLDKNWKSYFSAIKDWKKNPDKYLGMPKLPKYLKKDGRFNWMIPNNTCHYNGDGTIHFGIRKLQGVVWKSRCLGRLIQIRFVPRGENVIMEVVYEIEISDEEKRESNSVASIDLGVDNIATVTNNIGLQPFIINGKPLKSMNQFYNKRLAEEKSELKKRHNKDWSKKLETMSFKRFNRIKNYMHNASSYIIKWCLENNIDTLIIGKNKEWKQEASMHKVQNQQFIMIPYEMLIKQLAYKCQSNGITFITTEESYTSGTSFLDNEEPCKENYNKERRVKRGLFQSNDGTLINSDVNGSLQIMKKVIPNAFERYGIEAYLTPVVINVTEYMA